MQKNPRTSIAKGLVLAVLAAVLVSCSAPKYPYKDGHYGAEAAEFDFYGWKEYVTVYISAGQILTVEYNAFNAAGFIRSWDMDFMRDMNFSKQTHPNAYTRYYEEKFLAHQGTAGIDLLSGATHSYHAFIRLTEASLENARSGDATTRIVTVGGYE